MSKKTEDHYGYLHGYSEDEQRRLIDQAHFFEESIYGRISWPSKPTKILELGCGVGAQSKILLKRYPQLHITAVDRAESQLSKAKAYLKKESSQKRIEFVQSEGSRLAFKKSQFSGAFICWLLEHVKEPAKVLTEVNRVLEPGALVYCTEVMNSSFFLHPYAPATLQYWFLFNDHQWNMGGDPFVGAKLGNILLDAGFQDIRMRVHNFNLDKRTPKQRQEHLQKFYELLKSAAPGLLEAKLVDVKLLKELDREWEAAMSDPNAVLCYSFAQARAKAL